MEETKRLPKRIHYKESRTINIGDYESIRCELSYSTDVEQINEKEATVKIWADDVVDVGEDKDAFSKSAKRAMSRVRKVLDLREADIRVRTGKFVEHDTAKKALFLGLMDVKKWYAKHDKFKVEADLIEDFEDGDTEE
jgi:hypothetical protein